MISQRFAVIGGENHDRVFRLTAVFQRIQYPAQLIINQPDHRIIGADQGLRVALAGRFASRIIRVRCRIDRQHGIGNIQRLRVLRMRLKIDTFQILLLLQIFWNKVWSG